MATIMMSGQESLDRLRETSVNLKVGRQTAAFATTVRALSATRIRFKTLEMQALISNASPIAFGNASVVATGGSEKGILLFSGNTRFFKDGVLSSIYIQPQKGNEGVSFVYSID